MNSRERVLTTLRHEEPDRIPIDLDSMAATGIAAMAYNKLIDFLDLDVEETLIWDPHQLLAFPDELLLDRLQVDTRPVRLPIPGLDLMAPMWKDWQLPDGSSGKLPAGFQPVKNQRGEQELLDASGRVTHRLPKHGFYFDQVTYPLRGATSIKEIENYPLTDFQPYELEWIGANARRLYQTTDKAVVCRFRGSIVEVACSIRGWEEFMMDLLLAPKFAQALIEKLTDYYVSNLPAYLDAVAPYAHVIVLGDDLGNQSNTFFSVELYRKLFKPYHRKIIQTIKAHSNLFVFLHSDGNIRKLLPDLIEIGVDILNPVQFSAKDMEPRSLKKDFGDDLVFWGAGADTQHVLPFESPENIRKHVCRLIDIFAPGGGFVFTQVHNIQANVPPENILTMFDTAIEYGVY